MKDIPSREQYAVLHRWSTLLEQLAYKSGTRLYILLDLLRPEIRRNLAEGENVGRPIEYLLVSLGCEGQVDCVGLGRPISPMAE
jgi:hypothetical protein